MRVFASVSQHLSVCDMERLLFLLEKVLTGTALHWLAAKGPNVRTLN